MLFRRLRVARVSSLVLALACVHARATAQATPAQAAAPPSAIPTAPGIPAHLDEAEYRRTIDDAVREFGAGRFEEARSLFHRAHGLSPNARTWRGLGMTAFELRAYAQSIHDLHAALADTRKPLDEEMRAKVRELIDKAQHFVGTVRVELRPANAVLLVDGQPPQRQADGQLRLDAGTRVLGATADGYKPTNVRTLVEGGSRQDVVLALEPIVAAQPAIAAATPAVATEAPAAPAREPAPPPTHAADAAPHAANQEPSAQGDAGSVGAWAVGTLVGAGALGAGAAVFWLLGDADYDELERSCAPDCSAAQIDASGVKTMDALTTVFIGLAAASGAASLVLFTIDAASSDEAPQAQNASLQLRVLPSGAQLEGTF